jgi:hypothetical protein
MKFHIATGYAKLKPSASLSAPGTGVRVQSVPVMAVGNRLGCEGLMGRISSGLADNAISMHRIELERTSDRTQAAHRLQDMLTEMKDRVARKVSAKARLACAEPGLELSYKAS